MSGLGINLGHARRFFKALIAHATFVRLESGAYPVDGFEVVGDAIAATCLQGSSPREHCALIVDSLESPHVEFGPRTRSIWIGDAVKSLQTRAIHARQRRCALAGTVSERLPP